MSEKEKIETDVIIVGAGCSGLAAAYHIKKCRSDVKVLILEAKGNLCSLCISSVRSKFVKFTISFRVVSLRATLNKCVSVEKAGQENPQRIRWTLTV